MRRNGQLPHSDFIKEALEEAWGFNFYYPCQLLILRFQAKFAQWYVQDTIRHSTFDAIAYQDLPALVKRSIPDPEERQKILALLQKRPPDDCYFVAQIRVGDINLIMRLRDWRPLGEVIAPWSVRLQMKAEAEAELMHYQE